MQNKGLVRILAVCLALVCAFYLSFDIGSNLLQSQWLIVDS